MATTEQRSDGLYLIFAAGEEAGPFSGWSAAEEFLDYVDNIQEVE